MEYASKITIYGQKILVKSGLEIFNLKFLFVQNYFPLPHKIVVQKFKFSVIYGYLAACTQPKWIFDGHSTVPPLRSSLCQMVLLMKVFHIFSFHYFQFHR